MKRIALLMSVLFIATIIFPSAAFANEQLPKDELDSYIEAEFGKTHIPAMSIEIVSAKDVVFANSYGVGAGQDTPYILGSISKSFTAVAIMQLVEQGLIDITRPMADYLPTVDKGCKTSVKQLLNQTSGIQTYMTLENYTTSDAVAGWNYANVNYNLLGQIVENVSGFRYADYIQTYIFKPLGMTNSHVSLESAKAGGLIDGYRNYFGFMVREEMPYPQDTTSGWMTPPAAYIISTANDMGKYLQFYLNGGQGVLSPESITAMQTDTVFAATDYEYGYGWGADNRAGETILCHGGNVENYTSYMFILPERGLAAILLFNACDYFVANSMAVQLPYNVAYKLMGLDTNDIQDTAYIQTHLVINAILLVILLAGVLPLFRLKKWCTAHSRENRAKHKIMSIVSAILLHAVLPTLILAVIALLGTPFAVVIRFAPDVFLVQIISSALLYFTGVFKLMYCVFPHKKHLSAKVKTIHH